MEQNLSSLVLAIKRADVGGNKLKQFMIVSWKIKTYDEQLGAYDAQNVVAGDDCNYKLIAYDYALEKKSCSTPLSLNTIVESFIKLANTSLIPCPGIENIPLTNLT